MKTPTRLRLLRITRGLTQVQVAKGIGVSTPLVVHAESGFATASTMQKLAFFFGEVDPERLLERVAVVPRVPSPAERLRAFAADEGRRLRTASEKVT